MNILFLTRGYPSAKYVTHGIFEYDMAKALAKQGHEITYLAIDSRSLRRWRTWGNESFVRDGMKVEAVNIPIGRVYNPLKTKLSEWALKRRFDELHKTHGPFDVIHAHFIESAYLGARLKDYSNIPLVVTEHSSRLNGELSEYNKMKLSYAYAKADKMTVVSQSLSDTIYEKFKIRAQVIPNIVDTTIFKLKEEKKSDLTTFDFVTTGNLIPSKGMDLSIKAFSKIAKTYPHARLHIFGQGSEKERLVQLVEELQLSPRVKFYGLVKREVLKEHYRQSNVFVLASFGETFGVAYIEALAMGLPVIATNCGGPVEFIHRDNGLMVPVGDVSSLSRAMEKMINTYNTFNAIKISDEITKRYSDINNANALEEIYHQVTE